MKNKNSFARLCLAIATSFVATGTQAQYFQQFYPAPALFPNLSFKLVDGCNTQILSPGHLMLAHDNYVLTDFPYYLYRTDATGTYTGPNTFARRYMLYQGSAPMQKCQPGSVAEVSLPNGSYYEMAGGNPNAVFFMTFDNTGVPVTSVYYGLPVTNSTPGRWLLAPSVSTPNSDFFICGKVNNGVYVMRVNSAGTILWTRSYANSSFQFAPAAMMESPYNNGELLVTGKYTNGTNDDGFLMRISVNNGTLISMNRYFITASANDEFSSITTAQTLVNSAQGYVIGGKSTTSPATTWVTRVNLTGTPVWSNLIKQNALIPTATSAAITGIKERLNTSGAYEYYTVASSGSQAFVTKLNAAGVPVSGNSEFDYTTTPKSEGITLDVDGATATGGFTVYGNYDIGSNPGNLYMNKAYFNGYTVCMPALTQPVLFTASCTAATVSVTTTTPGITTLPLTPTVNAPGATYNLTCGNPAAPSVSGGSNARMVHTAAAETATDSWQLSPNPSGDRVSISGSIEQESNVSITVYDMTGRLVQTISNGTEAAGAYKKDISFSELGCGYGIYIIHIDANGSRYSRKLVYSPM